MENRTELKERRNNYLWIVFMTVFVIGLMSVLILEDTADQNDYAEIVFIGVPWLFIFYRVLTFCFNFVLAKIVKKRFKIDRLKGRVSPIYKLDNYGSSFLIEKFSVKYTSLDLEWSIPFSVLFEEQEYIKEGSHQFICKIEEWFNIEEMYEKQESREKYKYSKRTARKISEQQKIDNLNKIFNENYK